MTNLSGPNGLGLDALHKAIQEGPRLTLLLYSFGIILRKQTEQGTTEYPVSPAELGAALAANVTFDTGPLPADTLCVRAIGTQRVIAGFRRPAKTALWLEGSDDPIHVPLPGLILIRTTYANRNPDYALYATGGRERPADYDMPLYRAPLPNVYTDGGICWGTVRRGEVALAGPSLAEDWAQLLGSRFGNHGVAGKSRSHPEDIRQMYLELEKRRARVWPGDDLIPANKTLGHALGVDNS
jgi:hypothetical protein